MGMNTTAGALALVGAKPACNAKVVDKVDYTYDDR